MTGAAVLNKVLNYCNLNGKSFSEKIGMDRPQVIYDIQKGKTKNISPKMADKIISAFPEINKGWLLSGEGQMLNVYQVSDRTVIEEEPHQQTEDMTYNRFFEALERRDRQIDEILSQNSSLLRILERMQGASVSENRISPPPTNSRPNAVRKRLNNKYFIVLPNESPHKS